MHAPCVTAGNIPVCRSCITRMTQRTHSAIAQALTNDKLAKASPTAEAAKGSRMSGHAWCGFWLEEKGYGFIRPNRTGLGQILQALRSALPPCGPSRRTCVKQHESLQVALCYHLVSWMWENFAIRERFVKTVCVFVKP